MDQMEFQILLDEYDAAIAVVDNALIFGTVSEVRAAEAAVKAARKALIEYVFGKQE